MLAAFGLSVVVFAVTDVYRGRPDEGLRRNLIHLFGAWAAVVLAAVLLMYATQTGAYVSRQWLAVWGLLALAALIAMRFAVLVACCASCSRRGLFCPAHRDRRCRRARAAGGTATDAGALGRPRRGGVLR